MHDVHVLEEVAPIAPEDDPATQLEHNPISYPDPSYLPATHDAQAEGAELAVNMSVNDVTLPISQLHKPSPGLKEEAPLNMLVISVTLEVSKVAPNSGDGLNAMASLNMATMVVTFDVSHVLANVEVGPGLNEEASLNIADMSMTLEVIHALPKLGPGLKLEALKNIEAMEVTLETSHVLEKSGCGSKAVVP
jgi:hypothetical protein